MASVFVSHSSLDQAVTQRVIERQGAAGWPRCWSTSTRSTAFPPAATGGGVAAASQCAVMDQSHPGPGDPKLGVARLVAGRSAGLDPRDDLGAVSLDSSWLCQIAASPSLYRSPARAGFGMDGAHAST